MRLVCILICALVCSLPAAEGTTVATLDLERFLEQAKLFTSRQQKLQAELDTYNEQFQDQAERVTKLETRLSMTDRSDPTYDELERDIEAGKLRIKLGQKQAKERLEGQKSEMLRTSIQEALGLLEHYSDEQDIDLVLRSSAMAARGREELIPELQVLYRSPELDITEAFLAYANARFEGDTSIDTDADESSDTGPLPLIEAAPEDER